MRRTFVSVAFFRASPFGLPRAGDWILASLLAASLLGPTACHENKENRKAAPPRETPAAPRDLCALLSAEELERILGEKPEKTEKSEYTASGFVISQCVYHLPTESNSIVLSVTRRAPGPDGRDPRAFLEGKIEEREHGEGEEKESEKALDFVPGVGDRAIWMGTAVGGTFYVLKDNSFLRIGLGTTKEPVLRKEKAVEIARLLVGRM